MARTIPRLATVGRAYCAGRVSVLRPPTPLQAHRLAEALAGASPEIAAAYAAGVSADPRSPMPEEQAVLAEVVARLARPTVAELPDFEYEAAAEQVRQRLVLPRIDLREQGPAGDTSGPECASAAQLGHLGPAL